MSASSLYDLAGDALRLSRQIEAAAEELDSDDPSAALAAIEQLLPKRVEAMALVELKADAWCWVIERLRAQANIRKAKADALRELAAADEAQAKRLMGRLIAVLELIAPDQAKWRLANHQINSRRVESVGLDPDLIPADLPPDLQRVTVEPDKDAIKAAIKAGRAVAGAELVERRSWSIK